MAVPRPTDVGTIARRIAALEKRVRAVDASRRLSFAGTQARHEVTGFGIPHTTYTTTVRMDVPVPDWADIALIMATGTITAQSDLDWFYPFFIRLGVDGSYGGEAAAAFGDGGAATTSSAWSGEVSDAGGRSVAVEMQTRVGIDETPPMYPPNTSNVATINAMVLLLR
mgnify:CR=1 FL=1